jgi:ATP-dependent helicase/nuclease subunit A
LKIARRSVGSFSDTVLGQHADWTTHEIAELPYLLAEEDRLLYVAATRAREALIVSRSTERLQSPAWGVLNNFLAQVSGLSIPSPSNVSPRSPLDCRNALVKAAEGRQVAAHSVAVDPSWRVTSVTAEAQHIARIAGSMKFSADDPSKVLAAGSPSHRADAGQAWGALIHGLLEHAMSHENATAEDLQRLGMWLTVEEPQLRHVLELAVKTVLSVSKSDFWAEAKRSDCSVETPFAFAEHANAILIGVIDLMFDHEGRWRIIDYKTDVDSPELLPSYQAQLKMYERAMASIGIQEVTSAIQSVRGVSE